MNKLASRLYTQYLFLKNRFVFALRDTGPDKAAAPFRLSEGNLPSLEISVRMGCGLFCDYCPQTEYIERYKQKLVGEDRTLSKETFVKAMANVPNVTYMKWTGFTEPLDSKIFPWCVEYLASRQFRQQISTTLHGSAESVDWFAANLGYFSEITLHLPDDKDLMKSRVDGAYLERLRCVLDHAHGIGMRKESVTIFLIGDSFHADVARLLDEFIAQGKLTRSQITRAEILNTRNSTVDVSKLPIGNVKARKHFAGVREDRKFYCSYRRLNQGVMLPNGYVTLCCQDYGLDFLLGDLKSEPLGKLYRRIESDPDLSSQFVAGEFYPCTKCEHYKTTTSSYTGHLKPLLPDRQ